MRVWQSQMVLAGRLEVACFKLDFQMFGNFVKYVSTSKGNARGAALRALEEVSCETSGLRA